MAGIMYVPKTDGAKALEPIKEALNTAQLQWGTYADAMGLGYRRAYTRHEKTLEEINKVRRPNADAMYFVLSTLCVGFAGGFAGALMAPWVKNAATKTAQELAKVWNTANKRMVSSEGAKELTKKLTQGLAGAITTPDSEEPYRPASTDPQEYHLQIKTELGLCFTVLRERVAKDQEFIDQFHTVKGMIPAGSDLFQWWVDLPILRDQPGSNDMPKAEAVERQAELGMWIAWSHVRDWDYWDKAANAVRDGVSMGEGKYLSEYLRHEPIRRRLYALGGADHFASIRLRFMANDWYTVLNIHALKKMGPMIGGTFLSKIGDVIKEPFRELPKLASTRPIFTLTGGNGEGSPSRAYPPSHDAYQIPATPKYWPSSGRNAI